MFPVVSTSATVTSRRLSQREIVSNIEEEVLQTPPASANPRPGPGPVSYSNLSLEIEQLPETMKHIICIYSIRVWSLVMNGLWVTITVVLFVKKSLRQHSNGIVIEELSTKEEYSDVDFVIGFVSLRPVSKTIWKLTKLRPPVFPTLATVTFFRKPRLRFILLRLPFPKILQSTVNSVIWYLRDNRRTTN